MELLPFLAMVSAMAAGAFVAGYVPLFFDLSRKTVEVLSTFGVGVLVGTAFFVIIPEGIHTVYTRGAHPEHEHAHPSVCEEPPGSGNIGLALAMGFTGMLVLERLFEGAGGHAHAHGTPRAETAGDDEESRPSRLNVSTPSAAVATVAGFGVGLPAILGILVHSAVDGIAFGAISITGDTSVEGVVFMAIMLHKAPTAFGLISFLVHRNATQTRAVQVLVLFSLTAPLAAVLTFLVLQEFAVQESSGASDSSAMGLCLLFSAGTFLYTVSVHVLPEVQNSRDGLRVGLLAAGVLAPYFLVLDHAH